MGLRHARNRVSGLRMEAPPADVTDQALVWDATTSTLVWQPLADVGGAGGGGGGGAPTISNVAVDPNVSGFTITWTTDVPADSQVLYGADTSYGLASALDLTLVTSHSVSVAGLPQDTPYHFKVRSRVPQAAESADATLRTDADPKLIALGSGTTGIPVFDTVIRPGPIAQAKFPIIVIVRNLAATGGGVISGPVIQCDASGAAVAGGWGLTQNPGAVYTSAAIDWATASCGGSGQIKITIENDGVHDTPFSWEVRSQ